MKTIFYSLAGEGLGHACRTQALLENLSNHQVHLFTWGEAWDFFLKKDYPYLYKIAGIPFGRDENNKIDTFKTIRNFTNYLNASKENINFVLKKAEIHKPDLFISDFEGILPRAAKQYGKPLISIDNQHKFSRTTDKNLALNLRLYAFLMGMYAEWLCPKPDMAIISTFYHSAVKKKFDHKTILTNCFMRKSVENTKATDGDYVLVYYKSSVGPDILKALAFANQRVVVFNCPPEKRIFYNFEYHDVNGDEFIKYLAGCKAVFCAAGNQLLGETAYYKKPTFTIPEPNQPEQDINAHYISEMKYGISTPLHKFKPEMVFNFLSSLRCYHWPLYPSKRLNDSSINGVHVAVEQIEKFIN